MSKKIWTYIIGILLIVCGAFLIVKPEQSFSTLVYYAGLAILIVGIIRLISTMINKDEINTTDSFVNGGLNILLGLILMVANDITAKVVSMFIGIWLILKAITTLSAVANYKKSNTIDTHVVATGIIFLILGIIVLTTPIITIIFTGILLGIILIVIGVFTILKYYKNDTTYSVKVKKK